MLNKKYLNKVIDFAWADEISFDSIKDQTGLNEKQVIKLMRSCLLYTSPSPRDREKSRMPSSA